MQKKIIIVIAVVVFIIFLIWFFMASSKPLPGTKIPDLGRGHVPVGEQVEYNANPPTSGPHYEDWVKSGVYAEPKEDGNLVHSLEHGYVIMHYKCSTPTSTSSSEIATSASGETRNDEECSDRKNQLTKIYEKKGKTKLIVVPRPNLDSRIALTAWTYIDKFDNFDQTRIEKFIDAHLNQGPEKTME